MKMKGSKYITCVCTHTDTRVPGKRWYHRYRVTVTRVLYITSTFYYFKIQVEKNILLLSFMLQVAGINTCCKYELLDFLFCYTQIDHY